MKTLRETDNKVQSVVSASAIGWYGSDPQTANSSPFKEDDPAFHDFLAETCVQWEKSITPAGEAGRDRGRATSDREGSACP